jgi:hypothetical protein
MVEIRSIEVCAEQARAIADLMEVVPGIIAFEKVDQLRILESELSKYGRKFSSRFDYASYLTREAPAAF